MEILGGISNGLLSAAIPSVHIRGFRKLPPFPSSESDSEKVYKNCEHGGLCLDINALITLLEEGTLSDSGNCGKTDCSFRLANMRETRVIRDKMVGLDVVLQSGRPVHKPLLQK